MGAPTVAYKVSYTSPPRYSGSRANGLSATIRYKVDWADAFTFVNDVLGAIDGSPWAFPASPNLKATEATINPIGVKSGGSGDGTTGSAPGEYFEKAHIDLTFNSQSQQVGGVMDVEGSETIPALQFDQSDPIEMASFNIQYSPQMIRIPGGSLKWADEDAEGDPVVIPLGLKDPCLSGGEYLRKPAFNLNITLHNCLYINAGNFADKIGYVNIRTMWGNCKPESVLFDGVSSTQRSLSNGLAVLDVTLHYKWQKIGWNVAMGSNGQFYRYISKEDGFPLYTPVSIEPNAIIPPSQRWRPTAIS